MPVALFVPLPPTAFAEASDFAEAADLVEVVADVEDLEDDEDLLEAVDLPEVSDLAETSLDWVVTEVPVLRRSDPPLFSTPGRLYMINVTSHQQNQPHFFLLNQLLSGSSSSLFSHEISGQVSTNIRNKHHKQLARWLLVRSCKWMLHSS